METEGPLTPPERRILDALEAAEPAQATAVLSDLTARLHAQGVNGVNLTCMWNSLKRLLHRRGYFVATPAQLNASLKEIEEIGEGFDLFDLARTLAQYDAARYECRGLAAHRAIPELRPFAASCSCTRPRKEE